MDEKEARARIASSPLGLLRVKQHEETLKGLEEAFGGIEISYTFIDEAEEIKDLGILDIVVEDFGPSTSSFGDN